MTESARAAEIQHYVEAYQLPNYGMGPRRRADVLRILGELATRYPETGLLDVGAGRGETLQFAQSLGFAPVLGTEVVPELLQPGRVVYAEAHALPFADGAHDHVTCFDVMEHLLPEDVEPALAELFRVAGCTLTVSASERPSVFGGRDLHISKRPANEWARTMQRAFGVRPTRIGHAGGSPCWQVSK